MPTFQSKILTNGKVIPLVGGRDDLTINTRKPGGKYELKDNIPNKIFKQSSVTVSGYNSYTLRAAPDGTLENTSNTSGTLSGSTDASYSIDANQVAFKWQSGWDTNNSITFNLNATTFLTVTRTYAGFTYAVPGRAPVVLNYNWTHDTVAPILFVYNGNTKKLKLYRSTLYGYSEILTGFVFVAEVDLASLGLPTLNGSAFKFNFGGNNSTDYSSANAMYRIRCGTTAVALGVTLPA